MNEHFRKGFIKTASEKDKKTTGTQLLGLMLGMGLGGGLTLAGAKKGITSLPRYFPNASSVGRAVKAIKRNLEKDTQLNIAKGALIGLTGGTLASDVLNKNKGEEYINFENNKTRASTLGGGLLGGILGNYIGDRAKINIKGKNIAGDAEARKFLSGLNKSYRAMKKPSAILTGVAAGSVLGMLPDIIMKQLKKKKKTKQQ